MKGVLNLRPVEMLKPKRQSPRSVVATLDVSSCTLYEACALAAQGFLNDHGLMRTNTCRRFVSLGLFVALTFVASTSLALMPPHVTGTNVKNGVLDGKTLIIRGYTLGYSELKKDLSITRTDDGQVVKFKHELTCKQEGDCRRGPPGSCQERCELKVTLVGAKHGLTYTVTYLDLKQTFKVALTPTTPKKDGND